MTQRQCPADYDIKSCDLTGEWVIDDREEDEWDEFELHKELWAFLPITNGCFSVFNKRTGERGEAEDYSHNAPLFR